jgi:hypothetical protein
MAQGIFENLLQHGAANLKHPNTYPGRKVFLKISCSMAQPIWNMQLPSMAQAKATLDLDIST